MDIPTALSAWLLPSSGDRGAGSCSLIGLWALLVSMVCLPSFRSHGVSRFHSVFQ